MAKPGTFQKGKSGNPKGRTPQSKEVTELARREAPDAFGRIVWLAEDIANCNGDVRMYFQANNTIVERAYGKAAQSITATLEGEVTHYVARLPAVVADSKEWLALNRK